MNKNDDNEILSVDEHEPGWITIGGTSFSFFGQCAKSENKVYILAWNDAHIEVDEDAGKEIFVEGEFLLLENQKIILKGTLRRPNDGQVANNGTFIFNDWLGFSGGKNGKGLEGKFFAFNKKGEEIISHYYSANLGKNGLSTDGRYAICQTYHSDTTDGNTVTCFDLAIGKLLWQKTPETKNADAFEIDSEEKNIYFLYDNIGKFKYTLAGEFVDDDKWYRARIEHGTGYELIEIANQKFGAMGTSVNSNVADEILNLYLLAIERIDSEYFLAQTHRKIGEIYELINNVDKAIFYYELAQKYNPKVGVIKKLQKLKPGLPKKEKRSAFSAKLFGRSDLQLLDTGKSVQAGVAPRGTYFQIDHYNDACWYIKNNYVSGLDNGTSKISITNNRGELIHSAELPHLIYKAKRAQNSQYFISISYDLNLYLYSPTLKLLSSKKITEIIDDRYSLKCVDVSLSGELVVVTINDKIILYNKELLVTKEFVIPLINSEEPHPYFDIDSDDIKGESISAIQINDIDDMYLGTYSGKVFKFTKDGACELVCKCNSPIRDVKIKGAYLIVQNDKSVNIIKDGYIVTGIKETSLIIWSSNIGYLVTKKLVKLFSQTGLLIAELSFVDSIADAYLVENKLIVFTAKNSFVFGFSNI